MKLRQEREAERKTAIYKEITATTGRLIQLTEALKTNIIGASLSEPHTSESNSEIFIYIYVSVVCHSVNAS